MPDIITIGTLIIEITPPEAPVKVLDPIGKPGTPGDKGWSPLLVIAPRVSDDGKVLKVLDWAGGVGTKPLGTIGKYVGLAGLVADIADAVNVRGNATDGKDGSAIYLGSGLPANDLGNLGDLYIDLSTFTLFDKPLVGWVADGSFKGRDGIPGSDGEDGQDGFTIPGRPGTDGLAFRSGIGAPGPGLGADGDTYIDLALFDIYAKAAGAWTLSGNFAGTDGLDGQDGSSLLTGAADPTVEVGADGDSYINITTKHLWTRASATWTDGGTLKGSDGVVGRDGFTIPGDDGDDGERGYPGPPGQSIVGPAGSPGLQTIMRIDGNDGDDGDRGPPGQPSNVAGPAGAPGLQTILRMDGNDGDDGDQGPPGPVSTIPGPSGAPGLQTMLILDGTDGDDGDIGPPGPASIIPGPAGAPGLQTILRMDGNDGDDGDRGPPGPSIVGPAGSPGLQTILRMDGNDGDDGDAGPPGQSIVGPAGAAGASNLVAGKVGFAADKNAQGGQPVTAQTITKVTFGNEVFDFGTDYDVAASTWTPPAGLVTIAAGVGFSGGPYSSATAIIEIRKNGTAIRTNRQTDNAFSGLNSSVSISIVDNANGTDFYEIFASAPTLSSGSAFFAGDETTFFTGASVQGPAGVDGKTIILQSAGDDGEFETERPPGHNFNGGLVPGVVDGNNKAVGMIGETLTGTFIATAITSGTALDLGTVALSPGEWELTASVQFAPAATTSITRIGGSYSDTSAQDTGVGNGVLIFGAAFVPGSTAANAPTLSLPPLLVKITAALTKHLIAVATFSVSTMTAAGKITARRVG